MLKIIHTPRIQNVALMTVKGDGTYNYLTALKG
jgi:hypothetical protein